MEEQMKKCDATLIVDTSVSSVVIPKPLTDTEKKILAMLYNMVEPIFNTAEDGAIRVNDEWFDSNDLFLLMEKLGVEDYI